jgi:hypothetical protein
MKGEANNLVILYRFSLELLSAIFLTYYLLVGKEGRGRGTRDRKENGARKGENNKDEGSWKDIFVFLNLSILKREGFIKKQK